MLTWGCSNHKNAVVYITLSPDTDFEHYAFYYWSLYKGIEYSIECYQLPTGNRCEIRKADLLAQFNFIPAQLTPDTIDQKLGVILTFL